MGLDFLYAAAKRADDLSLGTIKTIEIQLVRGGFIVHGRITVGEMARATSHGVTWLDIDRDQDKLAEAVDAVDRRLDAAWRDSTQRAPL